MTGQESKDAYIKANTDPYTSMNIRVQQGWIHCPDGTALQDHQVRWAFLMVFFLGMGMGMGTLLTCLGLIVEALVNG